MDTIAQEVRTLYAVGGLALFIVLAVMGLLFIVYRSNLRVKDSTPALIDTQRALISELSKTGERHQIESEHTVKALNGIIEEQREGRKVQTSLVELVKEARQDIQGVRTDHATASAKTAARQAELHTEVVTTITTAQERIISEFKTVVTELNKTLLDLKQAIEDYRKTKRKLSPSLTRSTLTLVTKIDTLTKDFQNAQRNPPPPVTRSTPTTDIKPVYSVIRPDPAPINNGHGGGSGGGGDVDALSRYPSASEWLANGRTRR